MPLALKRPLTPLSPEDLDRINGSGGSLDLTYKTPPVRLEAGLTYGGRAGSVTGSVLTDGRTWSGGLGATYTPSSKVAVSGFYRAGGGAWEAGVSARIRFLGA